MMALNISPRPAGMKNEMKITPVATIRSLTQADTAREMRESIKIQIAEHKMIGIIIHKCDQIHPFLARPAIQKKCRLRLHHRDDNEVLRFHGKQISGAHLHQQLHRFVVGNEYVAREKQDGNEAKNQEDNEEARFEQ